MTRSASHANELLALVALAEIEQSSRTPLTESAGYSSLTTLLIGVLPEVDRLALSCGASAVIANAISDGAANVQAKSMSRWYPRETPRLALAAQRLRASLVHHEISPALSKFSNAIADAKQATLDFIMADSMSGAREVALAWRRACEDSALFIRAMDQSFGQRNFSGFEESAEPILAFLDEAKSGSYSSLGTNGDVAVPQFEGDREARRVPLRSPATVRSDTHECEAIVRDMSLGGLGLAELDGFEAGQNVTVFVGTMEFSGRLEWVKERYGGLCLDQRLDERDTRLAFLTKLRD